MNRNALRAAHTEIVLDVLTAGAVDHSGKAMQTLHILKDSHAGSPVKRLSTLKLFHNLFIGWIILNNAASPAGLRSTGQVFGSFRTPILHLMANQPRCCIDLGVRLLHFLEGLLVQNHIRLQRIQQGIQVIIVGLHRCCGQHHNSIRIIGKITCNLIGTCIRMTDMVRLINDYKVKVNRIFQIKQTLLTTFSVKEFFRHQRVRKNGLTKRSRPRSILVAFVDCFPERCTIQLRKALVKAFHLRAPFMLCNQRLRADDQNRLKVLVTRLQFTQDQTRLDGFTNTNAVCHKDTRTLRMNHFQCRTELVRSKIHTSSVQ